MGLVTLAENESKEFIKEHFYIRVDEYSTNEDLMNEILEKPPKWLLEVGDRDAQMKHLEERVLVRIFERFKYIPSEEGQRDLLPFRQ